MIDDSSIEINPEYKILIKVRNLFFVGPDGTNLRQRAILLVPSGPTQTIHPILELARAAGPSL